MRLAATNRTLFHLKKQRLLTGVGAPYKLQNSVDDRYRRFFRKF